MDSAAARPEHLQAKISGSAAIAQASQTSRGAVCKSSIVLICSLHAIVTAINVRDRMARRFELLQIKSIGAALTR
jgi:hypothetical protein